MWNMKSTDGGWTFFVYNTDISLMDIPAEKTNTQVEITREYGLKYFLKNNKKRVPFIAGMIICGSLIYIQSLFIWNINIEGESDYTKDEILRYIKNNYVSIGTLKSEINCDMLEKELRNYFQDIAWISCSITGTNLEVNLTETLNVFTDTGLDVPCNIVAAQSCTVSSIVTALGTPLVVSGNQVEKGDILISGAVYLYDDNQEILDTHYVSAQGEVWGICEQEYNSVIEMEYYKKNYTGKNKKYYTFGIFGYEITPYIPELSFDMYDMISDEYTAHVGKYTYFPFSLKKNIANEYNLELVHMSEEDARAEAEEKLQQYICDLQEKGVQIIENNVRIETVGEQCIATGTIKTCQLIGIPQELEVISEENNIE
jgi:similar to stage IV sporulation protein